jgi:hypothetical protein
MGISLELVAPQVYERITVKAGIPGMCETIQLLDITVLQILEHYT